MVDCAHRNGVHARLTREENIAVETALIELIKTHTEMGLAAVISPDRYESPPEQGEDLYVFAVRGIMAQIANEMKYLTRLEKGPVRLFFEAGHDSQHKAARVAETHQQLSPDIFKSCRFGGKTEYPLLQMADLLVWQLAKYVKDKVEGTRPPRKDYKSLVQQKHHHIYLGRRGNEIMHCTHESPDWETPDMDVFIRDLFSDSPATDAGVRAFDKGIARLKLEARMGSNFATEHPNVSVHSSNDLREPPTRRR